jgi:hypothetical protein
MTEKPKELAEVMSTSTLESQERGTLQAIVMIVKENAQCMGRGPAGQVMSNVSDLLSGD